MELGQRPLNSVQNGDSNNIGFFENVKVNYRERVIYWLKTFKYLPYLTDGKLTLIWNEYISIQE